MGWEGEGASEIDIEREGVRERQVAKERGGER